MFSSPVPSTKAPGQRLRVMHRDCIYCAEELGAGWESSAGMRQSSFLQRRREKNATDAGLPTMDGYHTTSLSTELAGGLLAPNAHNACSATKNSCAVPCTDLIQLDHLLLMTCKNVGL